MYRKHIFRCKRNKRKGTPRQGGEFSVLLGFLERNPTTFAFPSKDPPPPFPKARRKKRNKGRAPPGTDPDYVPSVQTRKAAYTIFNGVVYRADGQRVSLQQFNTGLNPKRLVWIDSERRNMPRDEAIAAGLHDPNAEQVWVPEHRQYVRRDVAIRGGFDFIDE